jgi:hypothetical protein
VLLVQSYTQDPASIGNALFNLATQILRTKLPKDKAKMPTNILNIGMSDLLRQIGR